MMPATLSQTSRVGATVIRTSRSSASTLAVGSEHTEPSYSPLAGRASRSFQATRQSPDRDGSLGKARKVGALSDRQQIKNTLGLGDRNDYVQFDVAASGQFQLSLKGLTANADVQLMGSSGQTLAISNKTGKQAESITCALDAGTYYVRVHGQDKTRYNLNLATTVAGTALVHELPSNPLLTPPDNLFQNAPTKWTVMVYMAGDTLETFGIEDFLEMSAIGSTDDVNLVVQFDRTAGLDANYGNWTDTRRGLVSAGDTPAATWGTSLGEVNMGTASSLSDFVTWGMNTYQADNYALVMWGHGSGFDVSYDDITGDSISAKELNQVLSTTPDAIDLVGADACLMATTEFAYEIKDSAAILVGSQELEPGQGWNYTPVLKDLTTNPSLTAAELGSSVLNHYGQYYQSVGYNGLDETLSVINLASLRSDQPSNLATAINGFASTVMGTATQRDLQFLDGYRDRHVSFGDGYYDYGDIGTIFGGVATDGRVSAGIRTAAQAVVEALGTAIVNNYSATGQAQGLSLYFSNKGYNPDLTYNGSNLNFAANTLWDEFLNWANW